MLTTKNLTFLMWIVGIAAVSYGMLAENTILFIAGLLCGGSGYLLIRRRLKDRYSDKQAEG